MGTQASAEQISVKASVLVVDDETGPRDALKVILRPFFTIHSPDTAKSALRVLKDQHIDLITLDQKLPDRQGIDLLMFGEEVENGELPDDTGWIGKVIQDICFNNAKNYFNWQLDEKTTVVKNEIV